MSEILEQALFLGGRILLAALLGVLISMRRDLDRHRQSIVQAHAFLGAAGALMIMIIGDQIERAVGLLGVASVIRYRYAIRNPRDAGTLIISLGLGMACGAGLYGMSVAGAIFILLIAFLLDLMPRAVPPALIHPQRESRFRIVTSDPEGTLDRVDQVLTNAGVRYTLTTLERKQREIGPPQTMIEGVIRFNGDLEVTDLTADIVNEHVLQISWREPDSGED
jgi:uncharacterized membrane protein YhiD involved in acid resistance